MTKRPFRFGVQEHTAPSGSQWRDRARALESMGYATLYLPDHFGEQVGPIAGLMAAADATTGLRIGSLVLDNDYRHPVVLAKEAASLDLLSDGRLDFGLGAGWLRSDYQQSGIPYDSPGTRIERMAEGLTIIKKFFTGDEFSFEGKHYTVRGLKGSPLPAQRPHPPIVIGGGGRRMLELAAREADIVNVNFDLREGRQSRAVAQTGRATVTDEKLAWIREAAGDRFDQIELGAWTVRASVTDDREYVAQAFSQLAGLSPEELLEVPHILIGTVDQIVADLEHRRDRYGFSHVIIPGDAADDLAPVVQRLAGT